MTNTIKIKMLLKYELRFSLYKHEPNPNGLIQFTEGESHITYV